MTKKWSKMVENEHFWKKNFENFFSKSIQNVSKRILNRKSWFRKKSRWNFFLELNHFWQKWPKSENFRKKIRKSFFLESIQNVLKRILNRKSWFRKKFPVEIFFLGLNHFLTKMAKKWKFSKKISKKFFLESIQIVSKCILNRNIGFEKKFPVENFFPGT